MLKIRQIPTHLNGWKSSCAKVNLSLSTQQQRSFLRWNFTKLLLEWPGLKLGLTSYLPIERKEVFAATDRGFTARRRLRLRLSPQTHSHFGKDTQDAMSRFFGIFVLWAFSRNLFGHLCVWLFLYCLLSGGFWVALSSLLQFQSLWKGVETQRGIGDDPRGVDTSLNISGKTDCQNR